jgi:hypothetical protein
VFYHKNSKKIIFFLSAFFMDFIYPMLQEVDHNELHKVDHNEENIYASIWNECKSCCDRKTYSIFDLESIYDTHNYVEDEYIKLCLSALPPEKQTPQNIHNFFSDKLQVKNPPLHLLDRTYAESAYFQAINNEHLKFNQSPVKFLPTLSFNYPSCLENEYYHATLANIFASIFEIKPIVSGEFSDVFLTRKHVNLECYIEHGPRQWLLKYLCFYISIMAAAIILENKNDSLAIIEKKLLVNLNDREKFNQIFFNINAISKISLYADFIACQSFFKQMTEVTKNKEVVFLALSNNFFYDYTEQTVEKFHAYMKDKTTRVICTMALLNNEIISAIFIKNEDYKHIATYVAASNNEILKFYCRGIFEDRDPKIFDVLLP